MSLLRKRKGPFVSEEYRRLHREGRVNGDGTGMDEGDEELDGPPRGGGKTPIGGDPRNGYYAMASDPGAPPDPPYWHGHSWQPSDVTWDESAGQFSDGSPGTGPGGGFTPGGR